ncbi:MAG: carbon-nitrogen hydrolase family protein [Sneathiellales bacterium]|nr:carbon-nitrogen hydrolase family protein [Sneathiellales bacterium]
MIRLMRKAKKQGADIILFPEGALSGYAPFHNFHFDEEFWELLSRFNGLISESAKALELWVVYGTVRENRGYLPFNSLKILDSRGRLAGHYDKNRLYKTEKALFSEGTEGLTLTIKGHKCGFLVCYDNCFPELYSRYKKEGVELLFHAFFNAGHAFNKNMQTMIEANSIIRAADNGMVIVVSNSSESYSPLSARIVRPDASEVKTKRHVTSIAVDVFPPTHLDWTYP